MDFKLAIKKSPLICMKVDVQALLVELSAALELLTDQLFIVRNAQGL